MEDEFPTIPSEGELGAGGKPAVLIVDDKLDSMSSHAIYLQSKGYVVVGATSYDSALAAFELLAGRLVIAVIDIHLGEPGKDGISLVRYFKEVASKRVASLVLSGYTNEMYKLSAIMAGALGYEHKPISPTLLLSWIESSPVQEKFDGMHDPLTGLLNYKAFRELACNRIETMQTRGWPGVLTLIIFDGDKFKDINDTYGHIAADRLLKAFGQIISDGVRPSDLCSRRSGDEFLILLHDVDEAGAVEKGRALQEEIRRTRVRTINGEEIGMTFSLGVSEARQDDSSDSPEDRYERMETHADERMTTAKEENHLGR